MMRRTRNKIAQTVEAALRLLPYFPPNYAPFRIWTPRVEEP
jgi:hypothetical protein